jgi:hypothetical protein
MGIEPTAQAWEAWVLPLYDARATGILVAQENAWQTLRNLAARVAGAVPCLSNEVMIARIVGKLEGRIHGSSRLY